LLGLLFDFIPRQPNQSTALYTSTSQSLSYVVNVIVNDKGKLFAVRTTGFCFALGVRVNNNPINIEPVVTQPALGHTLRVWVERSVAADNDRKALTQPPNGLLSTAVGLCSLQYLMLYKRIEKNVEGGAIDFINVILVPLGHWDITARGRVEGLSHEIRDIGQHTVQIKNYWLAHCISSICGITI
jgi:hypothetical protein